MKTIYANIWGEQKKVHLGTWAEIRKRGFRPSHRAFGGLNDDYSSLPAPSYGREDNAITAGM